MTSASGNEQPRPPARADQVAAVGLLAEPTRRELYERVVEADDWVSRDQVADATGLPRATAAYHLDRLVEAGLLEITFRRLSNRSGPGAGRPAMLYRRASRDVVVTLPPRDYELAGELLARAVSAAEGTDALTALNRAAATEGASIAAEMRARCSPVPGRGERTEAQTRWDILLQTLAEHGYEPEVRGDVVRLRNCPFHRLAEQHRSLVCGMNLSLLGSAVEAFGETGLEAALNPREGYCCVELRAGSATANGDSQPVNPA